jgi:transcriptional regulator GlxA family with amidase domain
MMPEREIHVGLLGYDGVQTIDVAGPLDAFASATGLRTGAYRTTTVSLDGASFTSESGLRITPDLALAALGPIDTLLIPGGAGLRLPGVAAQVAAAVLGRAATCRRIVSICTGIYGVAPSGLLDGRRATTHWRHATDVARRFPAVRLDCDRLFIKDGPLYTSAGVTAAIDLALALIEEDYGATLALGVARDLVVYLKRAGGQRQYSDPLQFQARAGDRFADLAAWIVAHLHRDLAVEELAARVALSPRQFSRRFTRVFGCAPAAQIEALRLDAARDHLEGGSAGVDGIASAVGFRSDDAFRRAFTRRFGISPTEYRRRFGAPRAPTPFRTVNSQNLGDFHADSSSL